MTDYTDPSTLNTEPRKPLNSELLTAAVLNPVAIAEGADGAPKIADKIVSGAGTTTVSGLEPFGGMIIRGAGAETAGAGSVRVSLSIEYSTDGGATFSAPQTIFDTFNVGGSGGGRVIAQIDVYIAFQTGALKGFYVTAGGEFSLVSVDVNHLTGTITGLSAAVTDIRLTGLDSVLINPQGGDTLT